MSAHVAAPKRRIVTKEPAVAGEGLLDAIERETSIHTDESKARFSAVRASHLLDKFSPDAVSKMASKFDLSSDDLKQAKFARLVATALENAQHISRLTKGVDTSDQDADMDTDEDESEREESESEDGEKEESEDSEKRDLDLEAARKRAEEANQQPEPRNREERFAQWHESMLAAVKDPSLNDPIAVNHFKNLLADSFQANSPESLAVVDQLGDNMIAGGMSLISSIVPHVMRAQFQQMMEEYAPGLLESHQETALHNSWADVIASDPTYKDLPKEFNSPEWVEMVTEVLKSNPWLESIQFPGMTYREALVQRGQILARLAMGEKLSPASVAKAFENGKQHAQKAQRKVTANRLGAGRSASAGSFGAEPKNDDFRNSILDYMKHQTMGSK
jgi:hypothetical protein